MKKTIKSFCLIAGLTFIFTGFCVAQTSTSKTFTGVSMVDISTISGSCEIVKSKDHMVHVTLDYHYRPANTFEPVFNQTKDVLHLAEKMSGSNSGHSTWVLMIPENIDIAFKSASGSLDMDGIGGKFEVNTASGNIFGKEINITEESTLVSASGNVEILLASTPEFGLAIASSSGNALLNYNGNTIQGEVEMKSRVTHGEISCPFEFDAERVELIGNQKYRVKSYTAGQATPSIKIHTASGNAVLKKQ